MLTAKDSLLLALCDPQSVGPPPGNKFSPRHLPPSELKHWATFHGVHSLLFANLQKSSWQPFLDPHWSAEMLKQLAPIFRADTARSLALRAQGERILKALRVGNISVLLLKGADFADHLYPRPGLRSFTDIDLLVRPADFQSAQERLLDGGCRKLCDGSLKHRAAYGETAFTSDLAGLQLRVELHWNLVNSPALQKTVSATLDDLLDDCGTLRDEGRLLLAAIHAGTGHQFDRLKFLIDLRQIFRRLGNDVDLPWLSQRIIQTGCGRVLATAIRLTEDLFQCSDARRLRLQLGMAVPSFFWRSILSPSLVLRSHPSRIGDSLRKNLYRQHLKTTVLVQPFVANDAAKFTNQGDPL